MLLLAICIASNSAAETSSTAVPSGVWGGENVEMQVTTKGASLEFACGSGEISEPLVTTKGNFSARGTYRAERGGPAKNGTSSDGVETVYTGTISDGTMQLTFKLVGEPEPQGPFALTQGHEGHVIKCH
jgi:hypothetical protein